MARVTAWRQIKDVMREAGVGATAACPKGLRHGFGVHAVRSGVPLNLLQRWLGHADIATTAIYADVMGPEEREIAARMW
ncbi:MAG: tyrosine-type recombinase/integrase [Methylobacterium radiotolerans]